jgi:penicillin-binding protein 1A
VRKTLLAYDRRHGYRGAESHVDLPVDADEADYRELLAGYRNVGGLVAALVTEVGEQSARVFVAGHGFTELPWEALSWARKFLNNNQIGPEVKRADEILAPGDVIRVEPQPDDGWLLAQLPRVSGALVSLSPQNGALQALVGGFDFQSSKFNRAMQAERQPGSSFKPFVYSAALDKGYTLASVFNDAPVVFDDPSLETTWRPENYSGKFYGPTRMREALTRSRNLVSIRLLQAVGPRYAAQYAQRFGFRADQVPKDLSLALGSGSATPMEMARGYSALANGGFYIEPYFIQEIRDSHDEVIFKANPAIACLECEDREPAKDVAENEQAFSEQQDAGDSVETASPENTDDVEIMPAYAEQVVDYDNIFLVNSMMKDVVKRGTGRRAMALGRKDLAGKTGTTNDQRDAWFCGFNTQLVTTVWVGFDRVQPLGNGETGGRAALPMWMDYMGKALQGVPESNLPPPPGLVTVRIDEKTGLRLPSGQAGGLFELFRPDNVPEKYSEALNDNEIGESGDDNVEPLF